MSKLLQLKKWLTVADAARHLTTVLSEPVAEADVLRLALDRHLTLSVNFVNHARARRGRIVSTNEAKVYEIPPSFLPPEIAKTHDPNIPIVTYEGTMIDSERVVEFDEDVITLDGVYDLPMIGAEQIDVEHKFQELTNGPEVTLTTLIGPFVQEDETTVFQIQERFEDNEFQFGSRARLDALKFDIELKGIPEAEARELLDEHAKDRKEFLARQESRPEHEAFYPANGLPDDAVLVVRTKALRGFLERIDSTAIEGKEAAGRRVETSYKNIIGALLQLLLGHTPSGKAHSLFKDQAAIIDGILASNPGKPGLSKRNLEAKFAAANQSMLDD